MKKLPIILAIVMTAIGGLGGASEAIALEGWESLGVVETNVRNADVMVSVLRPEYGSMDLTAGNLTEEWKITRLILATFDYKSGISMEQADHLATLLGEDEENDSEWTDVYYEYDWGKSGALILGVSLGRGENFLQKNPSDVIYYAVLEENQEDPTVAPKWVRGKWDYRTCAHASKAAGEGIRECSLKYDYTTDGWAFLPAGRTSVEAGIITWEEELKQLGGAELDAIDQLLTDYEVFVAAGNEFSPWLVDDFEADFGRRMAKVEIWGLAEVFKERIAEQEARRALLLAVNGNNETEEVPGDDNSDGEDTDNKSEETPGTNSGGQTGGGSENNVTSEGLPQDGDSMGGGIEAAAETDSGVSSIEADFGVVENTNTEVEMVDLGSLKITDKHPEVAFWEDEAALEVPNLGEVENAQETQNRGVWAILLAILGFLGVLGWQAGKRLLSKFSEEKK